MFSFIFRTLTFLFLLIFSIHVFIFLSLNIPAVQRVVLDLANKKYLSEYAISLKYSAIGVSFYPAGLTLTGAQLRNTSQTDETAPWLEIDEFTVGPDISGLGIFKGRFLDFIGISGIKILVNQSKNGDIEFPFLMPKTSSSAEKITLLETIRRVKQQAPSRVSLNDIEITVLNRTAAQKNMIIFDHVSLSNKHFLTKKTSIEIAVEGSRWSGVVNNVPHTLTLSADISLAEDLTLLLENTVIGGSFGDVFIKGNARIHEDLLKTPWNAELSGTLKSGPLLALAGLQSAGDIRILKAKGSAHSLTANPNIDGQLTWEKVTLEGFSLYDGQAQFLLSKNNLKVIEAQVKTPQKATITTSGEFHFHDHFPFELKAHVNRFSFQELMTGLGAPTKAVSFHVSAPEILVSGDMFPFQLRIGTDALKIDDFFVPNIASTQKFAFPQCSSQLKLFSDNKHLDLGGTQVQCGNGTKAATGFGRGAKRDGERRVHETYTSEPSEDATTAKTSGSLSNAIDVAKGTVAYNDGSTNFDLSAKNIDLSWISGFLNHPTSGIAQVKGTLQGSNKSPIQFQSTIVAHSSSLYGIKSHEIKTSLGINNKGVDISNMSVTFDKKKVSELTIPLFSLEYDDLKSRLDAKYKGDISAITGSLDNKFSFTTAASKTNGTIEDFSFHLDGPLLKPQLWSFTTKGYIAGLEFDTNRLGNLSFSLGCSAMKCLSSKVLLRQTQNTGGAGSLAIDAPEIEKDSGSIYLKASRYLIDETHSGLKGSLSGQFRAKGGWNNPEIDSSFWLDRLVLKKTELHPLSLKLIRSKNEPIDVTFLAQLGQITGRISLPFFTEKGNISSALFLNDLDIFQFFPQNLRQEYHLSSNISGDFSSSLSLADLNKRKNSDFLQNIRMSGNLKNIQISSSQEHLQLKKPQKISLENGHLTMLPMELHSEHLAIEVSRVDHDLFEDDLNAKATVNLNLGAMKEFFPAVSQADGNVLMNFILSGTTQEPQFSGTGQVENTSLVLKNLQPGFFNLRGRFIIKDDAFRLLTLRGRKGNGTVEATGTIDWSAIKKGKSSTPQLSLQMKSDNSQWRLTPPLLTSVDTEWDADLELSGQTLPYNLSGRILINRAVGFRDANCQEIATSATALAKNSHNTQKTGTKETEFVNLNLEVNAPATINLQTGCIKSKLRADLNIKGTPSNLNFAGTIRSESGTLTYQKTRFDILRALLTFDNPVRIDPKIDAELQAQIESYQLHLNLDGTALSLRPTLWSDPNTFPSGEPLTTQDMITMISRGTPPRKQEPGAARTVTGSLLSLLTNSFDDPLSQTFSKITGGFIDDVQLQPDASGNLKARISRSLGERLNLSLDLDPASVNSSQSLRGTWSLSDTINVLGGFDRKSSDTGTTLHEYSGDIRFQFGGGR